MKKRLIAIGGCLFALVMSTMLVIGSADAKTGSGRRGGAPQSAPEPISCVLFAAGGGTLVGLRYLRNRRKSRQSNDQHDGTKNVVS